MHLGQETPLGGGGLALASPPRAPSSHQPPWPQRQCHLARPNSAPACAGCCAGTARINTRTSTCTPRYIRPAGLAQLAVAVGILSTIFSQMQTQVPTGQRSWPEWLLQHAG